MVRFRVSDVLLPPADEVLRRLFGNDELEGCVVYQASDDRVAVAVPGLTDPVLVLGANVVRTQGAG